MGELRNQTCCYGNNGSLNILHTMLRAILNYIKLIRHHQNLNIPPNLKIQSKSIQKNPIKNAKQDASYGRKQWQ